MTNKKQSLTDVTEVAVRIPILPPVAAILMYLSQRNFGGMEVNLEDISPLGMTVVAKAVITPASKGLTPEEIDVLYQDNWDDYWSEDDEEELPF